MIPNEQVQLIKEKLIQQINSTFPEDKKSFAIQQVKDMNKEQLESFLTENKLIKTQESKEKENKCIFCSIVSGEIPSYKISENNDAIAILEINPISKGHCLVIPKEHVESKEKISKETIALANEISKKIKKELKPKQVKTIFSNILGHEIINLIPVYKDEEINSPRQQAKPEELKELQKKLQEKEPKPEIKEKPKEKPQEKKKIQEISEKNTWLPKRIP